MRAQALRRTQVDQQHDRQLAFLAKQFHERPARACRYVPIDRSHIVAELVRPNFFELYPSALEGRAPFAREKLVDDVRRVNLDPADLPDDFAWQHISTVLKW